MFNFIFSKNFLQKLLSQWEIVLIKEFLQKKIIKFHTSLHIFSKKKMYS